MQEDPPPPRPSDTDSMGVSTGGLSSQNVHQKDSDLSTARSRNFSNTHTLFKDKAMTLMGVTPSRRRRLRLGASLLVAQSLLAGSPFAMIYVHPLFENAVFAVILLNAAWIGVEIDFNHSMSKWILVAVENTFCILFTLELGIRLLVYRPHMLNFLLDPELRRWNIFDLVLVLGMILESWVLPNTLPDAGRNFKAFTLLRLVRLLRISRVLRMIPELATMVKSMLAAVRTVSCACLLTVGIMYIFATILTQWVKGYGEVGRCIAVADGGHPLEIECTTQLREEEGCICLQDYFGSMPATFLVLMQMLVLDDTFEIVRPVIRERFSYGLLLIFYILLVGFTVMNMLIGVLCEVISSVAQEEQESMVVEKVNDKFSAIVRELDTDNDGTLSWSEFEKIIDYPDAVAALDSVNVDPVGIVEMAEDLFWEDGAEVTVSFEEFMELVLDLRGGQPASVKDIMRLGKKFSQKFFSMNTKINRIDEKLDVIYAKLDEMWKL
mmetsp:Transcript_28057/g.77511  ORF Transcript_28057/g.77511 Transcript_28057/m.77511 type:complete len:494 (-) Transcript_28057:622-2103(-)